MLSVAAGGAATSVVTLSASEVVDERCRDRVCDAEGLDAVVERAKTWGWVATGFLAAGAVGRRRLWIRSVDGESTNRRHGGARRCAPRERPRPRAKGDLLKSRIALFGIVATSALLGCGILLGVEGDYTLRADDAATSSGDVTTETSGLSDASGDATADGGVLPDAASDGPMLTPDVADVAEGGRPTADAWPT